jgi:hypothetical protein
MIQTNGLNDGRQNSKFIAVWTHASGSINVSDRDYAGSNLLAEESEYDLK